MSYQVGVDLGTTYRRGRVPPRRRRSSSCRSGSAPRAVPSTVYVGPDGAFLIGEAAQRRALSDPGRVVRELKRRIGDATPVLVGPPTRWRPRSSPPGSSPACCDDVAGREGGVAARVAVTHPAGWGPHQMGALRAALAEHGLGSAVLVPEPQAAAVGYAAAARVEPGATVGIYDLGGGTLRRGRGAQERRRASCSWAPRRASNSSAGRTSTRRCFAHVRDALGAAWEALDPSDPEVLAAVAGLRRECTAAKEALSHDTEVLVPVVLPGSARRCGSGARSSRR